jgi:hypothetical protein
MKMGDILRDLAELLDQQEQGNQELQQEPAEPVEVDRTADDEVDSGHFIPPLQQKLELLKKAVGVASAYDAPEGEQDELARMRHLSGMAPQAVIHVASDDNDIVG